MNGADVRLGALERLVAAHERLVAKFQAFIELLPKYFFVALGHNADLGQIDRHNALVKAPLEFIVAVLVFPRGKKAAAPHGRKHVTLVIFAHFFGRDIIGIHALGRTLHRQFGDMIVFAARKVVVLV